MSSALQISFERRRRTWVRRLRQAGRSIGLLVEPATPGPAPSPLVKLTTQVKLQIWQRDTAIPQFEIANPKPLAAVPN
jgi:hypothetical protein